MLIFPINELLDAQKCYEFLLKMLHPDGLCFPNGHSLPPDQAPHDRHRDPIFNYKCQVCGKVYNIFTGTKFSGIRYPCATIILIICGILQGMTTKHLAEELGINRPHLLKLRHKIQKFIQESLSDSPLTDKEVESDEMFQNAREKGSSHEDSDDPPRRRANKHRGIGTMENDCPPILGVVGRESGQIRLTVCDNTQQATIQPQVEKDTDSKTIVYTDESSAYNHISETGRGHASVNHSQKEWARDDNGDGVREVLCNTMEGIWTGCRNFLRTFRGVHKQYLSIYTAIFELAHNQKRITSDFFGILFSYGSTLKNT